MADFSEFFSQQEKGSAPLPGRSVPGYSTGESLSSFEVSEIEQKISELQLNVASDLRGKIDDPNILDFIYQSLPSENMSQSDMSRFTKEYTVIKQQVAAVGMEQSNMAMGQQIDDLVARGVISQETADKQKMKNTAAINAVTKIYNKRLDAARISMARGEFFNDAQSGLNSASITSKVDETNRQIYNSVVRQALSTLTHRQGLEANLANQSLNASLQADLSNAESNNELISGLAELATPLVQGLFDKAPTTTSQYNWGGYEGIGIGNPSSYTPQTTIPDSGSWVNGANTTWSPRG